MLLRAPGGVLLVVLVLAVAIASAGCVKKDNPPPDATMTTPTGTSSTPTPPTGGANGTSSTKPVVTPVTAKGAIQGPFDMTWKINVPQVSPKDLIVNFNLTGAQPGAPPTASVYLVLSGPDSKAIKTATIGLGGSGDKVAWTLGSEAAAIGDYTLKATTQPAPGPAPTGLPSGGVANYDLFMGVDY